MGTSLKRRGADVGSGFQAAINSVNSAYAQSGRAYITRKAIPGKYLARRGEPRRGMDISRLDGLPNQSSRVTAAQLIALTGAVRREDLRQFVPESKAEPDYGGAIAPSGRAIFYDAKTTQRDRLDFDNLHPHQIHFLECMAAAGAISGFLVEFSKYRKVYFLPIQALLRYRENTGYKSVPFSFFNERLIPVSSGKGMIIFDYLAAIEKQESQYGADFKGLKV